MFAFSSPTPSLRDPSLAPNLGRHRAALWSHSRRGPTPPPGGTPPSQSPGISAKRAGLRNAAARHREKRSSARHNGDGPETLGVGCVAHLTRAGRITYNGVWPPAWWRGVLSQVCVGYLRDGTSRVDLLSKDQSSTKDQAERLINSWEGQRHSSSRRQAPQNHPTRPPQPAKGYTEKTRQHPA